MQRWRDQGSLPLRERLDPAPQLLERALLAPLHQHPHLLDAVDELVLPLPLPSQRLHLPLQVPDLPLVLRLNLRLQELQPVLLRRRLPLSALLADRVRVLLQLRQLLPCQHVPAHRVPLTPDRVPLAPCRVLLRLPGAVLGAARAISERGERVSVVGEGLFPGIVLLDPIGEGVATELEVVLRVFLLQEAADGGLPALVDGPLLRAVVEGDAAELLGHVLAGQALRDGRIVVVFEPKLGGLVERERVLLAVLAESGEVVLDVDALAELILELRFKVRLLTASLAQVQRGEVGRERGVVGELLQGQRRDCLRHRLRGFGRLGGEGAGNGRPGQEGSGRGGDGGGRRREGVAGPRGFAELGGLGRGVFLLLEVGDVLAEEGVLLDILGGARLALLVEGVYDRLLLVAGLLLPRRLQTAPPVVKLRQHHLEQQQQKDQTPPSLQRLHYFYSEQPPRLLREYYLLPISQRSNAI